MNQFRLNNKSNPSKPVRELVQFNSEDQVDLIGNKIYISPLLFLTVDENPFKLDERKYPIDFGSPWKNETVIQLEIPEGYAVESMPEKLELNLPDGLGSYSMSTKMNQLEKIVLIQEP